MNVRQQTQNSLGQDGFTNISLTPSSFFVHAINKRGQPVAMVVTPDFVTEVTELGQAGASQGAGFSTMSKQGSSMQQCA